MFWYVVKVNSVSRAEWTLVLFWYCKVKYFLGIKQISSLKNSFYPPKKYYLSFFLRSEVFFESCLSVRKRFILQASLR